MKFKLSVSLLFLLLVFVHVCHSGRVQNQRVRRPTATTTSTTEASFVDENDEDDDDGPDDTSNLKGNEKNEAKERPGVEPSSNLPNKSKQSDVRNSTTTESAQTTTSSSANDEPECSPPSINDFPDDIFTQTQRRFGAIIFHVVFAVYHFVAILKVCDDYFLGSLEIIAQVSSTSVSYSGFNKSI
jgi:cobalamin biosynthesis protein CobT